MTVDLYNEGVDLPFVDTLILLRPTQSPVLFQQQIGRGLRLMQGKESCLVLDFVGQHRAEFRFDRLFSSLTGLTKQGLEFALENGFGSLPPGCHIHLQPRTREQVLRSLRLLARNSWGRLRRELQAFVALRGSASLRLSSFIQEQKLEISEVYRPSGNSGWTCLKREVGLVAAEPGPEESYFGRRFAGLLHIDDPEQIDVMRKVGIAAGNYLPTSDLENTRIQMMAYQIDGQHSQIGSASEFLNRLSAQPSICNELVELSEWLSTRSTLLSTSLPGLEHAPLALHAAYNIREVLTAVGWLSASRRVPFQSGVLPLAERKIELLFVTLDKSTGFHDRIAYRDYAISPESFHWQSQNSAGPDTASGRRYLQSDSNGWKFFLFVRTTKLEPYRACGPVSLDSIEGDRPMSIRWKLLCRLPTRHFQAFSVLRTA